MFKNRLQISVKFLNYWKLIDFLYFCIINHILIFTMKQNKN
jgi:hypothetical protein